MMLCVARPVLRSKIAKTARDLLEIAALLLVVMKKLSGAEGAIYRCFFQTMTKPKRTIQLKARLLKPPT
jgi:hypothetical protein